MKMNMDTFSAFLRHRYSLPIRQPHQLPFFDGKGSVKVILHEALKVAVIH